MRATPVSADCLRGLADYQQLGPLTHADLARLDGMASDTVRRRTLANIYGRHGAASAWTVYQLHRDGAVTARGHLPRQLHGATIVTTHATEQDLQSWQIATIRKPPA